MLIYKCDICGMEEKKGVNEVNTQNQRVFAISKIGDFLGSYHICNDCLKQAQEKAKEIFKHANKLFKDWIKDEQIKGGG